MKTVPIRQGVSAMLTWVFVTIVRTEKNRTNHVHFVIRFAIQNWKHLAYRANIGGVVTETRFAEKRLANVPNRMVFVNISLKICK